MQDLSLNSSKACRLLTRDVCRQPLSCRELSQSLSSVSGLMSATSLDTKSCLTIATLSVAKRCLRTVSLLVTKTIQRTVAKKCLGIASPLSRQSLAGAVFCNYVKKDLALLRMSLDQNYTESCKRRKQCCKTYENYRI